MLPALVLITGLADVASASLPHAHAKRTLTAPVIDGRLDDAVWTGAPIQHDFTQKFPLERSAPSEPTTFRILYDDAAVYIGIDCEQRFTPIVRRLTRRDRVVEGDRVIVSIDSRGAGTSAFELGISASGVLTDGIRYNDTELDPDWDEVWDARVAETNRGWSAEIRIPLRILRFSDAAAQPWGLQVRRYVSLRQETDEWRKSRVPHARAVVRHHRDPLATRDLRPTEPRWTRLGAGLPAQHQMEAS